MLSVKAGLRRLLWPAVVVVTAVVVAIPSILLYQSRSEPVIFRYHDRAVVEMEPGLVVFNPFRDRAPERAATVFLKRLRSRKCDEIGVEVFSDPSERERICESEREHPLRSWSLKNRTRDEDTETLCYELERENSSGTSLLWLRGRKLNDEWTVVGLSAIY